MRITCLYLDTLACYKSAPHARISTDLCLFLTKQSPRMRGSTPSRRAYHELLTVYPHARDPQLHHCMSGGHSRLPCARIHLKAKILPYGGKAAFLPAPKSPMRGDHLQFFPTVILYNMSTRMRGDPPVNSNEKIFWRSARIARIHLC